MVFFSRNTRRPGRGNDLNVRKKKDYIMKVDENGHKVLHEKGTYTDIYAKTQIYAEDTKVENIIKRAALGDVRGLRKEKPTFGDITMIPQNLAEAHNVLIQLEGVFNSLPIDERRKFDFSFEKFIHDSFMAGFAGAPRIPPEEKNNIPPSTQQSPPSQKG